MKNENIDHNRWECKPTWNILNFTFFPNLNQYKQMQWFLPLTIRANKLKSLDSKHKACKNLRMM